MKFRKDFVTNSSSSSFICEICGASESGWDLGAGDLGFCCCVNGHTFCDEHLLERPSKEEMIKEILASDCNDETEDELNEMSEEEIYNERYTEGGSYEIPETMCPICQFIEYSESDLAAYLLKEYGIPRETVFEEVKKVNRRRKKLYDSEYITYVCQKHNLVPAEIVSGWKEKYGTYANFRKIL